MRCHGVFKIAYIQKSTVPWKLNIRSSAKKQSSLEGCFFPVTKEGNTNEEILHSPHGPQDIITWRLQVSVPSKLLVTVSFTQVAVGHFLGLWSTVFLNLGSIKKAMEEFSHM